MPPLPLPTQALLYYLGNDDALRKMQPALVDEMKVYGRCADEYGEMPDRWTPQLYVRESIRLRGAKVMTQADVCHPAHAPTAVGLSKWGVDVHAVQRLAALDPATGNWRVYNTGGRDAGRQHIASCPGGLVEVPYEALTPKRGDTANLLVPVCASFTHIAFATFRLESQYAVFGHASGTAAALALASSRAAPTVQDVNVARLRALLVVQKQLISSSDPPPPPHAGSWACAAGVDRCVGVAGGGGSYGNATCGRAGGVGAPAGCTPLAADEWLAHDCCGMWKHAGTTLVALKETFLKKSTADSSTLPAALKLQVAKGAVCDVVAESRAFGEYLLCRASR